MSPQNDRRLPWRDRSVQMFIVLVEFVFRERGEKMDEGSKPCNDCLCDGIVMKMQRSAVDIIMTL